MLAAAFLSLSPATSAAAAAEDEVRALVATGRHPALKRQAFAPQQKAIAAAYAERGYATLWFEGRSMREEGREALTILALAKEQGLDPGDYDVSWLEAQAARAGRLDVPQLALLDTGLTVAFARFLSDLATGRIDPATIHVDLDLRRRAQALAPAIRVALSGGGPRAAVAAAEPHFEAYRAFKRVLADYRRLAADPAMKALPVPKAAVKPSEPYAGATALRNLLVKLGDLPPAVPVGDRYSAELAEGVKRFQGRHGLEPDGILGRRTFAALNTPMAARVRQTELALERIRWLPDLPTGPVVVVNVPEFHLWAVGADPRAKAVLTMDVVVGREMTATPVFADAIQAVEFAPYWNVPPSIATKEIWPLLEKDPGHLEREDMELLGANGLRGDALLAALASGKARIRQRPGDANALGKVKFVMPNRHSIYLHDTPARRLFRRTERAYSHGCIRVEKPYELAKFVLAGEAGWSDARIREAMDRGENRTVALSRPVPVLIFYSTVNIDRDGSVRFVPDLYGYDAKLDAALRARAANAG